jgi:hypothetical protein
LNRRKFISSGFALAAAGRRAIGETTSVRFGAVGVTVPRDFTGLSYESAQLANPGFFSVENKELVGLFRGLSGSGNLRLGGGSSEFTTYSDADPVGSPPFEVFGPDTSKTVKHGTVTTAKALRNLRGFLDATGWNCLYGLNLGQGTKANAAAEAAAVARILGPRLVAFQIGNEPDSFRNRYRPATYGPAEYLAEWKEFRTAVVAAAPGAKFSGPDISNKLSYLTEFAKVAPSMSDVVLLTGHYYAMGPAGSPDATLEQLFDPDPKLATLRQSGLPVVAEAVKTSGIPFRMCEGNSCWDGGKPGVSDTFASALWCAGMMLDAAERGWVGVNLHGGGNGFYTPIAGAPSTGMARRPEYFGIQFGQQISGSKMILLNDLSLGPHVAVYGFERDGGRRVAVLNRGAGAVSLNLPGRAREAWALTGPELEAKDGVSFGPVKVAHSAAVTVGGYQGMIFSV